jgi:hypothetical protein
MSCCGNKRSVFVQSTLNSPGQQIMNNVPKKMWPDLRFQYIGETGLTIIGNVTGKQYRFNNKGEVQQVDYRDGTAMIHVPVLKKV